jgi:hypothetical protein
MPAQARWPDFFFVGVAKGASTSLYEYMRQHPAVELYEQREATFFNTDRWDDPEAQQAYLDGFDTSWDPEVVGEFSPRYLVHPKVPERIAETVGTDVRILMTLRDPLERAKSEYWDLVGAGREDRTFLQALEEESGRPPLTERNVERDVYDDEVTRFRYIERGRYAPSVRRFRETFGAENVRIFLMDEIKDDVRQVLREFCTFVGVDPDPVADFDLERFNTYSGVPPNQLVQKVRASSLVRGVAQKVLPEGVRDWIGNELLLKDEPKPPMPDEARELLLDVYEPDIAELEDMLDRDLPELRASWPEKRRPG